MPAKISGGAWFAEVGVFTATYLVDVFSSGAGTAAQLAKTFHDVVHTACRTERIPAGRSAPIPTW